MTTEQRYLAKDTWKSKNGTWYFSTEIITEFQYSNVPEDEKNRFCKYTEPSRIFHHYESPKVTNDNP